nr:putative ribonuclease H-like domain-containing protein [Tanacetum cinerariifolium]
MLMGIGSECSIMLYHALFKGSLHRQFWSTARIETTKEGTKILATVDGIVRTIFESSLRRNIKLRDEEGISSLPDAELFENLTLMGYNISPNQKFTFQKRKFSHQWKYLIHTIMQCLSPKSIGFNEFSSNIPTALVCLATNRTYNFSKMICDGLVKNVNNKGKDSGTPTEPHHTASPKAPTPSHTTHPTSSLPPVTTTSILTVTPTETTPIRHYTRRIRIAQSSVPLTVADEPAFPQRDVTPRVTSPTAGEGSMQHTISELTALCTSLQAQEVEINQLKERVKLLEERKGAAVINSRDDAPIKGRSMDEGEAVAERVSDDTEEMENVLTSMDAATVLASRVVNIPTSSGSIPTASTPAKGSVPIGSEEVPTASPVFATATVVTPYRRRKRKEVMIARDAEIARIHAEEEIQSMIDGLDSNNETIAKYLEEYHQSGGKVLLSLQTNGRFYSYGSKKEAEWIKRKGINLEQESAKKQKSSEEITEEAKSPKEVTEEKIKEMMQLVPIEEVYMEALQVIHPIIDWEVHTEGQRAFWKITRLGGSSASYQFFIDLLKNLNREDLNQLWRLVKETFSTRPPTSDKEMELWVELSKLYELDKEDQLVHHVAAKDKEIFMLVEKDYPLRKGLALVMICYKLQEERIDYEEVFALVARIEAIRLFLAYASFVGFMVYQMDVKSAFLYGTIEEEVYVCQPPGFEDPDYPDKVYKVVKVNDVMRLQALVDKKKVIISEATIRDALHLDDADGIECLPNEEIFTDLVRNVDSSTKFYMYPRFLQLMISKQVGDLSTHTTKYTSPALIQKVFANMRRVGKGFSRVDTPLFEGMIVAQEVVDEGDAEVNVDDVSTAGVADESDVSATNDEVPTAVEEPSIPSPTPPTLLFPRVGSTTLDSKVIVTLNKFKATMRETLLKDLHQRLCGN